MQSDTVEQQETRRTIGIFSLASFLHDIGSDMVFSVWPLFLTTVLGANMAVVGLIDGLGDALVSVSQAIGGMLSDRLRKRKVFVLFGYLFGGVARIGYALSPTWLWIVPCRVLDRSGKIRSAPRDAIISECSSRENRGKHFGILRMMDNLGAVVGIVLSILLIERMGYRSLFFVAAFPSVLAVLLVFCFIHEISPQGTIHRGIQLRDFSPTLRLYTLLSALFALGSFSYSFLLLAANAAGFRTGAIPILYLIFTLAAAGASLPAGKLSDRIGRKPVLLLSFAAWGGVLLLFLFFRTSTSAMIMAFVLYGIHRGMLDTVQRAFAAELAPSAFVASTLGGFQMVVGLLSLPASLLAGLLWDAFGIGTPLLCSLLLTAAASLLLVLLQEG